LSLSRTRVKFYRLIASLFVILLQLKLTKLICKVWLSAQKRKTFSSNCFYNTA